MVCDSLVFTHSLSPLNQTLRSQAAMATALKGVTKVSNCMDSLNLHVPLIPPSYRTHTLPQAIARMNSQMNLPQLQKIMMEFEREVN